jgi:hypothetical protein
MHFSSRRNSGLHPVKQVDRPPVSSPQLEDAATESDKSVFVGNFSVERISPGGTMSAVVIADNSGDAQIPEMQENPRF